MTSEQRIGPDEVPPGLLDGLPVPGRKPVAATEAMKPCDRGLKVVFLPPDAGWMEARIELGEQRFELTLSDVYDPFADMLRWLEAICVEVKRYGFDIDDEAVTHHFDAQRLNWRGEVAFSVMQRDWSADDDAPLWRRPFEVRVSRTELVGVFYAALRAMAGFPRPAQWNEEWSEEWAGPDEDFPDGDSFRTLRSDLVEQWLARQHDTQDKA